MSICSGLINYGLEEKQTKLTTHFKTSLKSQNYRQPFFMELNWNSLERAKQAAEISEFENLERFCA